MATLLKDYINTILLTLLVFLTTSVVAQNNEYSITARVYDFKGSPISGNIIILSSADSSVIKGTYFLEGIAEIKGIREPEVLVKITSPTIKDTLIKVSNPQFEETVSLGEITIGYSVLMDDVVIKASVPLFEVSADGTSIVNVEQTALSGSGTALDVLRQSPNVIVDNSENVTIFGKGSALIYIDGQLIPSNDILKALPSAEIRSIEIIENPSAKYDAAGRAVINIITKKNTIKGFQGELTQFLTFSEYQTSYSAVQLYYKGNKWAINGGIGGRFGSNWSSDEYDRYFYSGDTPVLLNNYIYTKNKLKGNYNYRFGASYQIDSLNLLSLSFSGFYNDNMLTVDNSNRMEADNVSISELLTYTNGISKATNNTTGLTYNRKMDTLGSALTFSGQYSNFLSERDNDIIQRFSFESEDQGRLSRNLGDNNINILSGRAEMVKYFRSNLWLDAGLKGVHTTNVGKVSFENKIGNDWIQDSSIYNAFSYKESILAGYGQVNYQYGKLTGRAGLRVEQTISNGVSELTGAKLIDRNYVNLFPSLHLGYQLNNNLVTGLTFSSRINRPTYQDLDPFVNYIDSLSSFRGNPLLKPEIANSVEWSFVFKKMVSVKLEYINVKDPINLVVEKPDQQSSGFVAIMRNLNKSETYRFGLGFPFQIGRWRSVNTFSAAYNTFTYSSAGSLVQNSKPLFYFNSYNEINLIGNLKGELGYQYNSSGVDGIYQFGFYQVLYASLSMKFLNNRLLARVIWNDILRSYVMRGTTNIDNYSVDYYSKFNTHFVRFTLNWKFGGLKLNPKDDHNIDMDEINRIKKAK